MLVVLWWLMGAPWWPVAAAGLLALLLPSVWRARQPRQHRRVHTGCGGRSR
jgi:hypothetical protein